MGHAQPKGGDVVKGLFLVTVGLMLCAGAHAAGYNQDVSAILQSNDVKTLVAQNDLTIVGVNFYSQGLCENKSTDCQNFYEVHARSRLADCDFLAVVMNAQAAVLRDWANGNPALNCH